VLPRVAYRARLARRAPGHDGDRTVLPDLLGQIPEGELIGTVIADGASDTRRCHTAIIDRQFPDPPDRKEWTPLEKGRRALAEKRQHLRPPPLLAKTRLASAIGSMHPKHALGVTCPLGAVCISLIHAMTHARSPKALNELTVFSQRKAMRRKRSIRLKKHAARWRSL
jgi:hypothetical protein